MMKQLIIFQQLFLITFIYACARKLNLALIGSNGFQESAKCFIINKDIEHICSFVFHSLLHHRKAAIMGLFPAFWLQNAERACVLIVQHDFLDYFAVESIVFTTGIWLSIYNF